VARGVEDADVDDVDAEASPVSVLGAVQDTSISRTPSGLPHVRA
jgi:hypothetical protein